MIAVTGASGFLGHHLVKRLVAGGATVRGIDIKRPGFEDTTATEFALADLRSCSSARETLAGCEAVYHLAADMGGIGYIGGDGDSLAFLESSFINANVASLVKQGIVPKLLFASSACVYPEARQASERSDPLREDEAFPAAPDTLYGWEKLNAERMFSAAARRARTGVRIARLHNVYGPLGTWRGGREKAPAAICRKVAEAKRDGRHEVEIWGDGEQRRSFLYIDDCIDGMLGLMGSDLAEPCNIGSTRSMSINELAQLVAEIAGWPVELRHVPGPQGVRSRSADITLAAARLGWQPAVALEEGMQRTYRWIEAQVMST